MALLLTLAAGLAGAAEWEQERFPAAQDAEFIAVVATASGDIVVAGTAAEVQSPRLTRDGHVARLDPNGTTLWERTYGRPGDNDSLEAIVELPDGDLVAAGTTHSFGTPQISPWILRLDGATGDVDWARILTSTNVQWASFESLSLSPDGRLVVTARAQMIDGSRTESIIELADTGDILAQRSFEGVVDLRAVRAPDGGTFIVGQAQNWPWVARLDAGDILSWQQGMAGTDEPRDLALLGDEALVLVGTSPSVFVRLDATGAITWQARMSTAGTLLAMDTSDGTIRACGSLSTGPSWRPAFVQIDASGALVVQQAIDVADWNFLQDTAATATGSVVVTSADAFLPSHGGVIASLDANGTLGPGCGLSVPLASTLQPGGVTLTPSTAATIQPASFVSTPVTVDPVTVTSCVSTRCSAIACADPCAEIASVEPIPACVGSRLTFEGWAGGNAPLTLEWDWDYTGTFVADASGPTASTTFATAGTHVVAFRVTDACGATGPRTALAMRDVLVRDCTPAGPTWLQALGNTSSASLDEVIEISTGGWAVLGKWGSNAWVLRIGPDGGIQWARYAASFGPSLRQGVGLVELPGGAILVGIWPAPDGNGPAFLTLDPATGDVTSARSFGASGVPPDDMVSLPGGGFAWCGTTLGGRWVVAMSDPDTIAWQQHVDGSSTSCTLDVAPDGSIVSAGTTDSVTGWVMRHGNTGSLSWQRSFRGTGVDNFTDVVAMPDGGAFLVGRSSVPASGGNYDAWLARLTPTGSLSWQKTMRGALVERALAARRLASGDVAIVGQTESPPAAPEGDPWLLVVDGAGTPVLQRAFDLGQSGQALGVLEDSSGSLLLAGETTSASGRVDGWLARLNPQAWLDGGCSPGVETALTSGSIPRSFQTTTLATAPSTFAVQAVTDTLVDATPAIRPRCASALPASPEEPVLLSTAWNGSQVVLHFTLPANAEAFSVYEFDGVIVNTAALVQVLCHLGPGHPDFSDLGDGTAEISITPSRDLTSYLVTASNWLGESPLGLGSGGPLDDSPSEWRCGASP